MSTAMLENELILITDPRVLAIPIIDNQEPLIDLIHTNDLRYGPSPEIPNNTDYTKMRKTVYEKLIQAQQLLPDNLRFCLYEAYRSINLQQFLFDERYKKVKAANAGWSESALFLETIKMVSPVTNLDGTRNIPAHSTGGAIDIYLLDEHGVTVDMGIHPKDWMDDQEGVLSATASTAISKEAQHYRKIMSDVLSQVGFVNYPTEFWHWSYGDRYWAYHKQQPYAIYGSHQSIAC